MAVVAADASARLAEQLPSLAEGLWGVVQGRRALARGSPPSFAKEWCGSVDDLQTLLEGSIILTEMDETEYVPVGTDELPAVKRAPGGLLVRVAKDVECATARYVQLVRLISTSHDIWPAVLASKVGDGALAGTCRAGGRDVAIRLAGRVGGRLALQVLERDGLSVVAESAEVVELARSLQAGPKVVSWAAFMAAGPWGDTGLGLGEEPASGVSVHVPLWEELVDAWGLPQMGGGDRGVEVPVALLATGSGNTILAPLPTDALGQTSATLQSTVAEAKTLTVLADPGASQVALAQQQNDRSLLVHAEPPGAPRHLQEVAATFVSAGPDVEWRGGV